MRYHGGRVTGFTEKSAAVASPRAGGFWPFTRGSGFQIQSLEFLTRRTKTTELINRRPHWRKCERRERLGEHFLQVGFGAHTNCDVRIKFFARSNRHKIGYIFNQVLLDVTAFLGAHKRCWSSRFLREGS